MGFPDSRALAESIIREVRQTACDCGYAIEPEFVQCMMDNTDDMVPYDSSMRLDYLAGRPMELQAIFAAPIAAAHAAGTSMRQVEALYQQLQFLDRLSRER